MTKRRYDFPDIRECAVCYKQFAPKSYWHKCCSTACSVALSNSRAVVQLGPCPTCGNMFTSKRKDKKYCSLDCYTKSEQFLLMRQKNLESLNPTLGIPRICRRCGAEYPRSSQKKYCSNVCRRKYMAERFDRWIANPENVALPQCFDEFLSRDNLPCPIDGCDWEGEFLGSHVNLAHGISAREFKKLCGFNITTGLVGEALSCKMSQNAPKCTKTPQNCGPRSQNTYFSLERKEHQKKALADAVPPGTFKPCLLCLNPVEQPIRGRKNYCSTKCRSKFYTLQKNALCVCSFCGSEFVGTRSQTKRYQAGENVCCSIQCRNKKNSEALLKSKRK